MRRGRGTHRPSCHPPLCRVMQSCRAHHQISDGGSCDIASCGAKSIYESITSLGRGSGKKVVRTHDTAVHSHPSIYLSPRHHCSARSR